MMFCYRKRRWVFFCFACAWIFFASLAFPTGALAQSSSSTQSKNEFGAWGAYSLGTPHLIGITSGNRLGVVAFRYGRILVDRPNFSFEWTIDVAPAEIVRQPKVVSAVYPCPSQQDFYYCVSGHQVVYGGGVSPLGVKFNFFRRHQLQFFGASTAGFVASVAPVPLDVTAEEQFNFTFDFQAGFQLFNSSRARALMFGYKYQHISNAYRGAINPGADFNMVFVGYSFFK